MKQFRKQFSQILVPLLLFFSSSNAFDPEIGDLTPFHDRSYKPFQPSHKASADTVETFCPWQNPQGERQIYLAATLEAYYPQICEAFPPLALRLSKGLYERRVKKISEQIDSEFPLPETSPATRGLLETLYNQLIASNPYGKTVANVHTGEESGQQPLPLSNQEVSFLSKRTVQAHKALEKLLGRPVKKGEHVCIALCGSGGGFRALLSFAGLLEGLDHAGVLSAVTYIAALSGSTWAVAPWLLTNKQYADFGPELRKRVTTGILGRGVSDQLIELEQYLTNIAHALLRHLAFGDAPSVVDLYGLMLGLSLFDIEQKKQYFSLGLTEQAAAINEGQNPLPLYTAVIAHQTMGPYSWVEFSPYEVSCPELGWSVPAWAFGRKFSQGSSINSAPPLSLGFLMGLWGSAISFSVGEAFYYTVGKLHPQDLFKPLQELVNASQIGNIRFFPVSLNNPCFQLFSLGTQAADKKMTLIDAGFDQNLPIVPLLNQERQVDLIIICDSSGDIKTAKSLRAAEEYAKKNKIPFPPIDYDKALSQPFSLFDGGKGSKAPMILYFPLVKNNHYSSHFDPLEYMGINGFLNTTNFSYTATQARAISGLFNYTAQEARSTIKTVIEIILHRKKRELEICKLAKSYDLTNSLPVL